MISKKISYTSQNKGIIVLRLREYKIDSPIKENNGNGNYTLGGGGIISRICSLISIIPA